MPKVTDEYVKNEFMRRFARMPREKRIGTIEALLVCDQVMSEAGAAQTPLFSEAEPEPPAEVVAE